jgi:hypothetical protein
LAGIAELKLTSVALSDYFVRGKLQVHNGAMRVLIVFLLIAVAPQFAQTSDEKDVLAAVQKTFDGMAVHDAAMIRSSMLPDARLYSVRGDAAPTVTAGEAFATQIAAAKGELLERFVGPPTVSIRGPGRLLMRKYFANLASGAPGTVRCAGNSSNGNSSTCSTVNTASAIMWRRLFS